ncbi:hypothetical protein FIU86_20255 (plasmid) [Roseovarius sp. THAF9]|nr:hypothetical protein FIU86_20255 [Roseovarius sp. THAF9]
MALAFRINQSLSGLHYLNLRYSGACILKRGLHLRAKPRVIRIRLSSHGHALRGPFPEAFRVHPACLQHASQIGKASVSSETRLAHRCRGVALPYRLSSLRILRLYYRSMLNHSASLRKRERHCDHIKSGNLGIECRIGQNPTLSLKPPFIESAAKPHSEPRIADAAVCLNVCFKGRQSVLGKIVSEV